MFDTFWKFYGTEGVAGQADGRRTVPCGADPAAGRITC
jgi:hypothetical protein